jgi:phasin
VLGEDDQVEAMMADDERALTQGIPQNVRDMAESSLEQARRAVEQYLEVASRTLEVTEKSAEAVQAGARDIRSKAIDYAETNVRAAFEFAERLVRAQDLQEIASVQQEFLRRQTEQTSEQMRALATLGSTSSEDQGRSGKTTKSRSRHQSTGD